MIKNKGMVNKMDKYYTLDVAGVKRDLPLCPLNDSLSIAAFVIFGDVELTVKCAEALLKIAPADFDVMITAESKGIPLIHEMARQQGVNKYILARKSPKLYMKEMVSTEVTSITTAKKQTLYLDGADMAYMHGKKVLIVDDVISTGESLTALETLVEKAGGVIVGKMAVLAEGDAQRRDDIRYLAPLPLFDAAPALDLFSLHSHLSLSHLLRMQSTAVSTSLSSPLIACGTRSTRRSVTHF